MRGCKESPDFRWLPSNITVFITKVTGLYERAIKCQNVFSKILFGLTREPKIVTSYIARVQKMYTDFAIERTSIIVTNMYIKAKKSLGQNFLIDPEALSDISTSIEVTGKHIIEVGPGYGALTEYLIHQKPRQLDLIELDTDMIEILEERQEKEWKAPNFSIHHQDVLKFIPKSSTYSVIANIPYYITSPILFHFLYPKNN